MDPAELVPSMRVDTLFSTLTTCLAVSSMLMVAAPVTATSLLVV